MCLVKHGSRLFYPADELYVKAGLPLPPDEFYEDYAQIQNGVGMITDMKQSVLCELEDSEAYAPYLPIERHVSVATGYAAEAHMREIADILMSHFKKLKISIYPIKNNFFGENITVSGLLTGKDITEQLTGCELGDALLIPAACLRAEGDVLLDDMSPADISQRLGVPVSPADADARKFISAILAINP